MPIAKKKPGVTNPGSSQSQSTGFKPGQPAKGADAFMQRLKDAKAATPGFDVPPGQYEAIAHKAEYSLFEDSQKEAVFIEFAIVNDDKIAGKTTRVYYNLIGKDGSEGQGYEYMKRDLEMVGCDAIDISDNKDEFTENLKNWFDENKPWVVIDVKKNGQFTNVYLNSMMDDQEGKPELPF